MQMFGYKMLYTGDDQNITGIPGSLSKKII